MENPRILIIGSDGLFGSAVRKICTEVNLDFLASTHEDTDIANKNQLKKRVEEYEPNVIINAAAMLGISACEENPEKAFEINGIAPLELARICQKKGIVLVQTSTNAVFDGEKNDFYDEKDTPNPKHVYGLSKYVGEVNVQNNLEAHYITRFPKLFGSRQNSSFGFIHTITNQMRRGEELRVAGDRFDPFTYTVHAARKVISLVQDEAEFGVYHVANQGTVSYYDFACKFAEKIGFNGRIRQVKDCDFPAPLAPNPLRIELGSVKIDDMLSWEEALDDYIKTEEVKL